MLAHLKGVLRESEQDALIVDLKRIILEQMEGKYGQTRKSDSRSRTSLNSFEYNCIVIGNNFIMSLYNQNFF